MCINYITDRGARGKVCTHLQQGAELIAALMSRGYAITMVKVG